MIDISTAAAGFAMSGAIEDSIDDLIRARGLQVTQVPSGSASLHIDVHMGGLDTDPRFARDVEPVNLSQDHSTWADFIGQEPLKRRLEVYLNHATTTGERMPHVLLASGRPGVGKTMMAKLIAKRLGGDMIELLPPFNVHTLAKACAKLVNGDVLFIDEIHKLADMGGKGAEILLTLLTEDTLFLPDGTVVPVAEICVVGATTEKDRLPEPVVDRFGVRPFYQDYTLTELALIANRAARRQNALAIWTSDLAIAVAQACRNSPRVAEQMVGDAKNLATMLHHSPTPRELLEFMETEPDGLDRLHILYLTALRQYSPRRTKSEGLEYVAGEAAICQMIHEAKETVGRAERFLIEKGLIDRTPRGRRLTERGIARAEAFIAAGKGVRNV